MRRIEDIYDCTEKYRLIRPASDYEKRKNGDAIGDELSESDHDMGSAKRDQENEDYKWATIKAYYSMYHSAKAYLRANNLIGKNHECILLQLGAFAKKQKIDPRYVSLFEVSIGYRIDADYEHTYDGKNATTAMEMAGDFNSHMKDLIREAGY